LTATSSAKKIWSILDLITWGTSYLNDKGISDARLNIELLLAHVLHLQRIQLYTNFDKPLSEDELALFKELLKRRLSNEPLQYILGETEFMGLKFAVNRDVLIPRPDTEVLVETVMSKMKEAFSDESEIRILEIGTGSGCIAVSLAKLQSNVRVVALDKSEAAVAVAVENAKRNKVSEKIPFECKDFLTLNENLITEKFHCIVSNPPYISNEEYQQLPKEVKDFEPKNALADGNDGLTFYKAIAEKGKSLLLEKGFVAVEHAYNQSEDVQKIFQQNGWKNIQVIKDYGGNFRCVLAEK